MRWQLVAAPLRQPRRRPAQPAGTVQEAAQRNKAMAHTPAAPAASPRTPKFTVDLNEDQLTRAAGRAAGGFIALGLAALVVDGFGGGGGQCSRPVTHNLKWGTADDYDMAERICCHNTRFAEPSGYFENKDFFRKVLAAAQAEG